jgi:hypothetical protein
VIYQATNGTYRGRTGRSTLRLFPDGTVLSNRTAGKLVRSEGGRASAVATLERWGAEPLSAGEDPLQWRRLWRPRLTRPIRHGGCHRYLWSLDRRRRRDVLAGPSLPYPKLDGAR